MPTVNEAQWQSWVKANRDPYGKACVDVAREVMRLLDAEPGDFDTHRLICRADDAIGAGGITGFMAGCVAQMVVACHSRGREFNAKWNRDHQIGEEGDLATQEGKTLNPALISVNIPAKPVSGGRP